MTDQNADHTARRPTRSLSDLVMPRRPSGVPYGDGDDYDARALITANGYTDSSTDLIDLLSSDLGVLQAAAARVLGAKGERSASSALKRLANDRIVEETVRVQAAFALIRLDVSGGSNGKEMLITFLELSPEASPAPLQAAGILASLGDPRGFGQVRTALDSANRVTAMIACKQLFAFARLDGQLLSDGSKVDVYGAFGRALGRPEPNIAGEARAQLEALNTDKAKATLAAHPAKSA